LVLLLVAMLVFACGAQKLAPYTLHALVCASVCQWAVQLVVQRTLARMLRHNARTKNT